MQHVCSIAAPMKDKSRRWLSDSIRKHLIPAFLHRGFHLVPLNGHDAERGEIRSIFPFGRLRRETVGGYEMIEIQFDKHGRAAFRLNIGVAPTAGIEHAAGPVAQEDIWMHFLDRYGEVYHFPLLRRWFSLWCWERRTATESDFDALVKGVAELVPELERALSSGRNTRHVRWVG